MLRLLAPSLGELLAQLERDRHRTHAELRTLRHRLAVLEGPPATGPAGGGPDAAEEPPAGRG